MGEVYRARDTTLGRTVAIKVVSTELVGDSLGEGRLEREARALAALNHPYIATLYGVEPIGNTRALVMEFVEGDTLADRLAPGPLPVTEAFTIGRQIAEALEAAHAKGIIHRDLKPANVKLTPSGHVKVLDFGLAKAAGAIQDQLTTVADATREGVVIGTAQYMSPQQARGQSVERDADIWAFGCVLYEMLTSRRAFSGATMSDTIANVLQGEPDWTAVPQSVPAEAVRLIRRCLMKDPAGRLRDIADARLEIEDWFASGSTSSAIPASLAASSSRSARSLIAISAAALCLGGAIGLLASRILGRNTPTTSSAPIASVFGMSQPSDESLYLFVNPVVISPDASQIAIVTNGPEGRPRLWLRSINNLEPTLLEDASGAMFPFWSPDGRSLGFSDGKQLRVMNLANRSVRTLAELSGIGPPYAAWGRDGTILYADGIKGLKRVPAEGGTPVDVAAPGPSGESAVVGAPQFLPDGHHFLYGTWGNQASTGAIMLGDFDSSSRTKLLSLDSLASYAAPGYLLYARNGDLVAHRFNITTNQLEGDPTTVSRGLWVSGSQTAFSASETGVIALATQVIPATQLMWVDRSGKTIGTINEPGMWVHVAIAPDGKTVAAERIDPRTGFGGVWTIDVARSVTSRVSQGSTWDLAPFWSPGGDRLAYNTFNPLGTADFVVARPDGSNLKTVSVKLRPPTTATDWLPDGRTLVVNSNTDVMTVPLEGDGQPTPLVQTPFNEGFGKISPDGGFIAYASNESGRPEIYVRPLGGSAGRVRVSQSGGMQPRWRGDGKELFFVSETGRIMASTITISTALEVGVPVDLSIETERDLVGARYVYDVTDQGRRFLVIRKTVSQSPPPITVLLNWPALVR